MMAGRGAAVPVTVHSRDLPGCRVYEITPDGLDDGDDRVYLDIHGGAGLDAHDVPRQRAFDRACETRGRPISDAAAHFADPHTESGRLGTALNVMLDARSASERRLRRFLADASHELRTPLTSIQGFAELYRRGGAPPGPALDEAMGRIEGEVSRMRLLVNDLLLLARLDEERPLDRHPVDLLAVAADTVRDAHVRVPTRFVRLAGLDDSAETFEPVTVLGDESRIRQVVTNLVANALQHTPDDCSVVVRVGAAA